VRVSEGIVGPVARRRKKKPDESDLVIRDGALCLTFVNTGTRRSPRLRDYADLLVWAGTHGALSSAAAGRLERLAGQRPEDAAAAFAAAGRLHALLSQIVSAAVDRKRPPALALHGLNLLIATVVPRAILVPDGARVGWDWPDDPERELCRPLWPVARSAMDLVASEDCGRVKRCPAKGCGVLFLHKGGGRPRKWCNARSCGDPERSRRYYRSVTKPTHAAFKRSSERGTSGRHAGIAE
jgi:predicted RNA-binding Zn ribbon-like protein